MAAINPTRRSLELRSMIEQRHPEIQALLRRYGDTSARLFGSVARGDADEDSDIDVTFPYPEGMGLHTMNRMERQLSELPGVNVDMVPDSALLETVRPSVLADAVPL